METRQHIRIQEPFVRVPIRDADGVVDLIDLWREDRFDPDPDGDLVYLVLDLSMEERLVVTNGEPGYEPTGSLTIEMQAIHRVTGEGLAMPHTRTINPSIPEPPKIVESFRQSVGGTIAYEFSTRPITGLTHLPVSPRRSGASGAARD